MYFVGRKKETQKILKPIRRGENVLLKGKYGIGKTSLIRQIATNTTDEYHFIFTDFSVPSGKICQKLMASLLPEKRFIRDRKYNKKHKPQGFKTSLYMLENERFKDQRKPVIVFDDIADTTPQKLTFVRRLAWAKRFQFIAIVENFIPEKALLLLRAELIPADIVTLANLPKKRAREFFNHIARENGFDWTESYIEMLSKASRGYPLGMQEMTAQLKEREMNGRGQGQAS